MHKLEGVSFATLLGTVVMERLLDILIMICAILLLPLIYTGRFQQVFPWIGDIFWKIVVGLAGISAILVILLVNSGVSKRCFLRLSARIAAMVDSFRSGFKILRDPGICVVVGILSIMIWGLYVLMMYLSFYAFGMTERYSLTVGSGFVVQAISSIGIAVPTPGSIGSYHFFAIQALTKLYNVDGELARSYATLTHGVSFLTATLLGVYYYYKLELKDVTAVGKTAP